MGSGASLVRTCLCHLPAGYHGFVRGPPCASGCSAVKWGQDQHLPQRPRDGAWRASMSIGSTRSCSYHSDHTATLEELSFEDQGSYLITWAENLSARGLSFNFKHFFCVGPRTYQDEDGVPALQRAVSGGGSGRLGFRTSQGLSSGSTVGNLLTILSLGLLVCKMGTVLTAWLDSPAAKDQHSERRKVLSLTKQARYLRRGYRERSREAQGPTASMCSAGK